MNERIKSLLAKAHLDVKEEFGIIDTNRVAEKFAELIVQECMSMCDERRAVYFGHRVAADDFVDKNMYAEGEAACDAIRYKIKQHFGVEE